MQFKNRCPVCMKFFCCSAHKTDHIMKAHKVPKKERPELLLKMFQRKAEIILMKSQQYHAKNQTLNSDVEQNPNKMKRALKRTHSTMTRQILTASVTVLSQSRPIIIPIRKLCNNNLGEQKTRNDDTKVIISPCDTTTVKTSTPITGHLQDKNGSGWNNMLPSSTSKYLTPTNIEPLPAFKTPIGSARTIITPLRGIIAKTSKYESGDSNPSPYPSLMRSRRVTFSFSSQVSSTNSSPLESVPEETKDKINIIEIDGCVEATEHDKENSGMTDVSSSSPKEGGFFSCVTSIFCSAVHTLENTWKQSHNRCNISKRSRSQESLTLCSPVPKRRCYPWDLRNNPIRARKPISEA